MFGSSGCLRLMCICGPWHMLLFQRACAPYSVEISVVVVYYSFVRPPLDYCFSSSCLHPVLERKKLAFAFFPRHMPSQFLLPSSLHDACAYSWPRVYVNICTVSHDVCNNGGSCQPKCCGYVPADEHRFGNKVGFGFLPSCFISTHFHDSTLLLLV